MAPVTIAPQAVATASLNSMESTTSIPTTLSTQPPPTPPAPPFPPVLNRPQVYFPSPALESPYQAPPLHYRYPPQGHYYAQPCKCDFTNQIRYYNHKDRDFYYHTALRLTTARPPVADVTYDPSSSSPPLSSSTISSASVSPLPSSFPPYAQYYDPYGPLIPRRLPIPPNYHPARQTGGYHHYFYQDNGLCEGVIVLLALLLWLYSFYRLYLVWQNTLNFSESSIQGPQGWDLLVNWVVERIRLRKLALRVLNVPGMSTKRRTLATRRGGGVMVSVVGTATPSGAGPTIGDEGEDSPEGTTTAIEMELAQRTTGGGNDDLTTKQDAHIVMQSCDSEQCYHSCGHGRESFRGGGVELSERNQAKPDHPITSSGMGVSNCGLTTPACRRPVPNEDETFNGCEGGKKLGGDEVERV